MRSLYTTGIFSEAVKRLKRDSWAKVCFVIIVIYTILALLVGCGMICRNYDLTTGDAYEPPSWRHPFGTDIFGRDVAIRVIYGINVSMTVGLIVVSIAVPIGVLLGALAGFYGGFIDDIIVWLYQTIASIPGILLVLGLTYALGGKTIFGIELRGLQVVYISLGLTSWIGLARIIRAEVMKHKEREYIQAARALGVHPIIQIFKHILPNILYLIVIQASLMFVGAILAEVIITFLGLGVESLPSWGRMIDDARMEWVSRGVWWQITSAGLFMFVLVLSLNIFADSIRDAVDPRLKDD